MSVLGAVLAGGASSRFGSDKALAEVGGRTLLDLAQAVLAGVADEVVIVGRAGGIPDRPGPGLGPLGGIAGALDHARRHGFASVMTIGCDMPEVPAGLLAALRERTPSYCAEAPVMGHWPITLADGLLAALTSPSPSSRPGSGVHRAASADAGSPDEPWMPGRARHDGARSVRRWADAIGAAAIASPVALTNVNTPADLPR